MLAVENAEISGTLIALSIPGLKPLFQRWLSNVQVSFSKSLSNGTSTSASRGSQPSLSAGHKLDGVAHYERAASDISNLSVSKRESNDSLLNVGRDRYLDVNAGEKIGKIV